MGIRINEKSKSRINHELEKRNIRKADIVTICEIYHILKEIQDDEDEEANTAEYSNF